MILGLHLNGMEEPQHEKPLPCVAVLAAARLSELRPRWHRHNADEDVPIFQPAEVSLCSSSHQRRWQTCPVPGQASLTCTARCPHRSRAPSAPAHQAESNYSPRSRRGGGSRRSGARRQHTPASGCAEGRCTAPSLRHRDVSRSRRLEGAETGLCLGEPKESAR